MTARSRVRSVQDMKIFQSIRDGGFRRGPERLVGGVAAGLARQFGMDVWLVRLLVLLAFALPGIGVAVYLAVWAVTPWQDGSIPLEQTVAGRTSTDSSVHGG